MAGRLRVYIEPDADPLIRETRAAQATIGRLKGEDTGADGRRASSLFTSASTRAAAGFASAAAGVASAAASFFSLTQLTEAVSVTQDLAKSTKGLHENLGLSIKESSQWAATAYVRGVDSAKLGMAFKTLSTQIVAARDGSESAVATFDKLGFSQADLQRGADDSSFLLSGVADGLKGMRGGADKAAVSGRLFGRGWQSVAPVLRDGAAEMQRTLRLASKYGATFDGKALTSINDLIGAQRELQFAQLGLRVQFTQHLAPSLASFALDVAEYARDTMRGKTVISDFVRIFIFGFRAIAWAIKAIRDAAEWVSSMFGGMRKVGSNLEDAKRVLANTKTPIQAASRSARRILDGMGDGFSATGKFIARVLRPIGSAFRSVARFIANVVEAASNSLSEALSRIPTISVDLPSLKKENYQPPGMKGPIRKQHGGRVQRLASGGLVQALGPYDIPPIQYDANHAGGNSHLHLAMSSVGAAKALAARIRPLGWIASEAPWAGGVTVQHQDPGHYTGSSFDANSADESRAAVAQVARLLGGGSFAAAVPATIGRIKVKGRGPLAGMSQRIADRLRKTANEYIAKHQPAAIDDGMTGLAAGVSGSVMEIGRQMMLAAGWPASEWPALRELWTRESGWNPNAVNPSSGAYGIPQALGHGHPYNLGDARAQIAWGLRYIRERYGSPSAALAFHDSHNWYQEGGPVDGGGARLPLDDLDLDAAFAGLEAHLREHLELRQDLSEGPLATALTGLAF